MKLWHATRALKAVLADGWVRPMRMSRVYAFSTREAAEAYTAEFGYEAIVEVEADPSLFVGKWKPTYASGAEVHCFRGPLRLVAKSPESA